MDQNVENDLLEVLCAQEENYKELEMLEEILIPGSGPSGCGCAAGGLC